VDDETGYWIEGPTGDDIRSAWRGQKLHHLLISALLHPRATNLPSHAQSAYVQGAIKLFLRACLDCSEEDIAMIIAVVRSGLGVFLQSVNIEVQERASTFRYLIAELGILSMTWEAELKEKKKRDNEWQSKAASVGSELLEVDKGAFSNGNTIQGIDAAGARVAVEKRKVLGVVIGEAFYAVHHKAQKRVPIPEGLDLSKAFSSLTLKNLLGVEVPENGNLGMLSFATIPQPSTAVIEKGSADEEEQRIARLAQTSWGDESNSRNGPVSYSSFQGDSGPVRSGRNPNDSMFYLSGSRSVGDDVIPLSQILAETFDDKGKKGKRNKKGKGSGIEIDTREMLPAGAISSDDEAAVLKKKKGNKKSLRRKDETELDTVDLTTPLRADEVLIVPKHREVPTASVQGGNLDTVIPVDGFPDSKQQSDKRKKRGKKRDSKDKQSKSVKENTRTDEGKPKSKKVSAKSSALVDDLLGLDWTGSAAAVATSALVEHKKNNDSTSKEKSSSKNKSTSKKSGKAWLSFYSDKNVNVFYECHTIAVNRVVLELRVVNCSKDGGIVSLDISATGAGGSLRPTSSPNVRIASDILVGAESQGDIEFQFDGTIIDTLPIECALRISVESLLGPEITTSVGVAKVTACVSFEPHKVDEEGLVAILGKSSSRWASTCVKLTFHSKLKSAFRCLNALLRGHLIESEGSRSKATSICSKTKTGGYVCALAKIGKDGATMNVDVKCLCGTKDESQSMVDAIAAVLVSLDI